MNHPQFELEAVWPSTLSTVLIFAEPFPKVFVPLSVSLFPRLVRAWSLVCPGAQGVRWRSFCWVCFCDRVKQVRHRLVLVKVPWSVTGLKPREMNLLMTCRKDQKRLEYPSMKTLLSNTSVVETLQDQFFLSQVIWSYMSAVKW